MEAYSYVVVHKESNRFYYGVRKSGVFDLGTTYFTSSKLVRRLFREHGIAAFRLEKRREFDSYTDARKWEAKLLSRIKCVTNPKCLNQAVSSARVPSKDSTSEQLRRAKISKALQTRWQDPEQRKKMTRSSDFYSKIASMKPKAERKPKQPKSYKVIRITRGSQEKEIRQNQLSAYKKCGWSMCKDSNLDCAPI